MKDFLTRLEKIGITQFHTQSIANLVLLSLNKVINYLFKVISSKIKLFKFLK